jgi:hypothetical protein
MANPLSIQEVLDKTYKVVIDSGGRNTAFHAYNQMYKSGCKSGWDLPPEVRAMPWIQKVVNSDPYDAVQTGVRIISTIMTLCRLVFVLSRLSQGPSDSNLLLQARLIESVLARSRRF